MYTLKVGEIFHSRYSILAQLGKGGMGEVYHARQLDADREVALKLLAFANIAADNDRERFLREFRLLSQLSNQHIMCFYNMAITEPGVPYAVCELIEGKTLRCVLFETGRLPWERTVIIWMQICNAMGSAHKLGIVHRDLKPENVMLQGMPDPDFVKLIDFGLSKAITETSSQSQSLTFTGQLIGTPHYMSPEQGSGDLADERSDIYSLACLIFELLSGEKLFNADSPIGILHQQANTDPETRLQILDDKTPQSLLRILAKMLQKSPDLRYTSMKEIENDLKSFSANEELHNIAPLRALGRSGPIGKIMLGLVLAALLALSASTFLTLTPLNKHLSKTSTATPPKPRVEQRINLLPRDGFVVSESCNRLVYHHLRPEAESLAKAWLDKYGVKTSNALAAGLVAHDLYGVLLHEEKNVERKRLLPDIRFLLGRIQPSNSEPNTFVIKYNLMTDILDSYTFDQLLLPEKWNEFKKQLSDARKLVESAEAPWVIWDNAVDLSSQLINAGMTQDAKSLLDKYPKHLADNVTNLSGKIGFEFFSAKATLAVMMDEPEQAAAAFTRAHRCLATITDKDELPNIEQQIKAARKLSFISSRGSREWLQELMRQYDMREPDSTSTRTWQLLSELASSSDSWNEQLNCTKRFIDSYLKSKSGSERGDTQLFNMRIELCKVLLQLKSPEFITNFRQACQLYKPSTGRERLNAAYSAMHLSKKCFSKHDALELTNYARETAGNLLNNIHFAGFNTADYCRLASVTDLLEVDPSRKLSTELWLDCLRFMKAQKSRSNLDKTSLTCGLASNLWRCNREQQAIELVEDPASEVIPYYKGTWYLQCSTDLLENGRFSKALSMCQRALNILELNPFQGRLLEGKLQMIKCRRLAAKH